MTTTATTARVAARSSRASLSVRLPSRKRRARPMPMASGPKRLANTGASMAIADLLLMGRSGFQAMCPAVAWGTVRRPMDASGMFAEHPTPHYPFIVMVPTTAMEASSVVSIPTDSPPCAAPPARAPISRGAIPLPPLVIARACRTPRSTIASRDSGTGQEPRRRRGSSPLETGCPLSWPRGSREERPRRAPSSPSSRSRCARRP